MKIKTTAYVAAVLVVLVAVPIIAITHVTTVRINAQTTKWELIDKAIKVVALQRTTVDRYLQDRNDQQAIQWQKFHAATVAFLQSPEFDAPDEQLVLEDLREQNAEAKQTFARLVALQESGQGGQESVAIEKTLIRRMLELGDATVEGSYRLGELGNQELADVLRQRKVVELASLGVLISLIVLALVLFVVKIVNRLTRMAEGIAAVSRDPDHTLVDHGGDEIGTLASTFNGLIGKFKQSSAQQRILASIVSDASDAVIGINRECAIVSWNSGAERILGFLSAEITGQSVATIIPPQLQVEESELLARIWRGEMLASCETRRLCKDGSQVDVSLTISPIRDAVGDIVGASKILRDISERKRQQRALKRSENTIRRITTSISDCIWSADVTEGRGLRYRYVSPVIEKISGVPSGSIVQSADRWLSLVHPDDRGLVTDSIASLVDRRNEVVSVCYRVTRPDGSTRWIEDKMTVEDHQKEEEEEEEEEEAIIGPRISGVMSDVTDRYRTEQELAKSAADLARSNAELQQFAYAASHDLRAPLRAIDSLSGWLENDLRDVMGDESREHVGLLRARVSRMEALLASLLEFAQVGHHATVEQVDPAELLRDVLDLGGFPAGFEIRTVGPLPTFETARLPLQRVLMNLVTNAVKHHHRKSGRIDVTCEAVGDVLEFSVVDDGPGIEPRFHDRVFGMFQALKPRDHVEGSGMGLALVKKLVENVGGTIRLESDGASGTAVRFTWPKRWPETEIAEPRNA